MAKNLGMKKSITPIMAPIIALLCVSTLGLSACQQDPFADKSDAIKQGVPPELDREPPVPKPMASDSLRIDSNDFYSFKERAEGEIVLGARILQNGSAAFELSIDNMADFPGATFDAKTGSFRWTPPAASTGSDYGIPKRLIARLTAADPTGVNKTIGTTKAILVYLSRAEVDPEIVSIDRLDMGIPLREGEVRKFEVTVKDPDSGDFDGGRPVLQSVPAKRGTTDVSGLVYLQEPSVTETNPKFDATAKTWLFKMVLDLRSGNQRGRDFTATKDKFQFGLQAVSRYGRIGMKSAEVEIVTEVLKPEISWTKPVEFVADKENSVQFTVYDPMAEGQLTANFVTRLDRLPGAAAGSCDFQGREGNLLCQISWKPAASAAGQDFDFQIEVVNATRAPGDSRSKKETFTRKIKVIPNPVPTPAPNPAPTPAPNPVPPVQP